MEVDWLDYDNPLDEGEEDADAKKLMDDWTGVLDAKQAMEDWTEAAEFNNPVHDTGNLDLTSRVKGGGRAGNGTT